MFTVYGDTASGQNGRFTKNILISESMGGLAVLGKAVQRSPLAALSASPFTAILMGPVKAKGLFLNSAALWEGAGCWFFGYEKGKCYDMLLERADCSLCLLGIRTQKNWAGRMKGESARGSTESTAQFRFEPRRPEVIKLGSLNKPQMNQYLTHRIKFSFWSETSTG